MSVLDELGLPELPEPLPRPIIDNHTHLLSTEEYSGLSVADNVKLAAHVGVTGLIDVGCDVASSRSAVQYAASYPGVRAAVAIHPNDAAQLGDSLETHLDQLEQLITAPKVVAVGETGLDYFRTREAAGQAIQEVAFRRHIGWAKKYNKTLVIHDRDAHQDVLRILDDEGMPERVVMHCFSGDAAFAHECLQRGAYLSFPGVVTFGSADTLRQAARVTPIDKILVETDAPYLTPKPQRGKANAPYLLPHTLRFLADLLQLDVAQFCDHIVANTHAAYCWGDDA